MDYYHVEASLQALLSEFVPLSSAQTGRIGEICMAVLLAGNTHFSALARWVNRNIQQDSRITWLKRSLASPYLRQEHVYRPFVQQALSGYRADTWHLVMDRTNLQSTQLDLLSVTLSFRRRAIPLVWQCLPHGRTDAQTQMTLLRQCAPLVPTDQAVIFHGDGEFDSVALMQFLQAQHWDFIVGQPSDRLFRQAPDDTWQSLKSLSVTKSRTLYKPQIELTKKHQHGPLNLFAFYRPHYNQRKRKQAITYCATSLPSTSALRRIGRWRWGVEPYHRDYKSSGWQLQLSHLLDLQRWEGLLTILAVNYLWTTCCGRWLCKTGQRRLVDARPQRHLSLFRIGRDWLVHCYRSNLKCPALLTLYQ
jgi:hypothetical protein